MGGRGTARAGRRPHRAGDGVPARRPVPGSGAGEPDRIVAVRAAPDRLGGRGQGRGPVAGARRAGAGGGGAAGGRDGPAGVPVPAADVRRGGRADRVRRLAVPRRPLRGAHAAGAVTRHDRGMTAPDMDRRPDLRQLVARVPVTTRRYQGPSALAFSPDGSRLAFVSGLDRAHAVCEVDVAGGEPAEVLRVPGAQVSGVAWSPAGDLFASADRGGTERWQVYVRRPDGRVEDIAVSEGDRVQHLLSARAVSPDGRLVAVSSNARDPEDVDVVLIDAGTGARRPLVEGPAWHVAGGWSPDGRRLAVARVDQNTDQTVLLVDPDTGDATELTPHAGEEQNVPAGWLADGRPLVITDRGQEHLWLAAVDPATGEREAIARPEWGVELATASADGRTVAWTVNEDGYSRLWHRTGGGHSREIGGLDGVVLDLALSPAGDLLAYSYQPVAAPAELRLVETAGGAARTLRAAAGGADERLRPETVRIPGPRGGIPAFVYRPGGEGRLPAVLLIHGGPEAQSTPRLAAQAVPLLAAGIAVVAPNVHGSTGYGKSWQTAIHRRWGAIDLEDFRAVADWMAARPDFDPERLAVMGGAYGGFATRMCCRGRRG